MVKKYTPVNRAATIDRNTPITISAAIPQAKYRIVKKAAKNKPTKEIPSTVRVVLFFINLNNTSFRLYELVRSVLLLE